MADEFIRQCLICHKDTTLIANCQECCDQSQTARMFNLACEEVYLSPLEKAKRYQQLKEM